MAPVEFQLIYIMIESVSTLTVIFNSSINLRTPGLEFVIRSKVFIIAEVKKLICSSKYFELS